MSFGRSVLYSKFSTKFKLKYLLLFIFRNYLDFFQLVKTRPIRAGIALLSLLFSIPACRQAGFHSVALLCNSKMPSIKLKIVNFHYNQKSQDEFIKEVLL
jgi:hypothetical protein